MKHCLAVLFTTAVLIPHGYAAPIGMILRVSGEVELIRGPETQAALPGEVLEEGDRVRVGTGEVLISFCPENARFRVGPGTQVELGAGKLSALEGGELSRVGTNTCSFPKVRLGDESLERVGALRPRGKPPIPVYLGGVVSTGHPRFSWNPVESSDRYSVRLLNEMGARIWEQETGKTSLDYPADRPALESGWYSWELNAFQGREVIAQQSTGFEVRAGEGRPLAWDVDRDLLLPTAFSYEADGYYCEAATCLRRYVEAEGNDERLRKRMAWLYFKAGLLTAFNNEMESRAR